MRNIDKNWNGLIQAVLLLALCRLLCLVTILHTNYVHSVEKIMKEGRGHTLNGMRLHAEQNLHIMKVITLILCKLHT